jgi:hypothetical protein
MCRNIEEVVGSKKYVESFGLVFYLLHTTYSFDWVGKREGLARAAYVPAL